MSTLCPRSIVIDDMNLLELQTILSQFGESADCVFDMTQTDLTIHLDNWFQYQIKATTFETYLFPKDIESLTFAASEQDLIMVLKGAKSNSGSLKIESPTELKLFASASHLGTVSIRSFKINRISKKTKIKLKQTTLI